MKEVYIFNKYSIWGLAILITLPFLTPMLRLPLPAYFDAFDKLSLPLWAALYSYFWIVFTLKVKKLRKQIPFLEGRVKSLLKFGNKEYISEQLEAEKNLSKFRQELIEADIHLDFINIALRVTIILTAIVKIVQTIIE